MALVGKVKGDAELSQLITNVTQPGIKHIDYPVADYHERGQTVDSGVAQEIESTIYG
jgi:hypothetical protein